MDDRKRVLWASSLLLCAGCFTTGLQRWPQGAVPPPATAAATAAPVDANAKKDPKVAARLLVASAKFNESEANAPGKDAEQQFKIRYEAKERYQLAMKMDPNCVDAHRGLGRIYVDLADFDRAQDIFKKAQAKFPKESVFWFEQGQMHNRRKDFAQAAACLQKALDMEPENRGYLTTLGFTLARSGQTEQSVALLTRSMGGGSAHYNVARMLLHLQRTEEGMQHLRMAVQASPNLENARELLSELENSGPANVRIEFQAGQ